MVGNAIIALAVLLGTVACPAAVFAQSPAQGAHFPTNAEDIEFLAGDNYAGEDYRLMIARDRAMQQAVYDAADPYDVGQWFITPREHSIGRGTYFWHACWTDWDLDVGYHSVCGPVRTLDLSKARIRTLTVTAAKAVVCAVFDNRGSWASWSGKRYGCHRVSRIRMRCGPAGWAGDTEFAADLRIVNRLSGETRVSGRIVYSNEYCTDVTPEKDCTDSEPVSGLF